MVNNITAKKEIIYIAGREIYLADPGTFTDRIRTSCIDHAQFDKLTKEDLTCSKLVFEYDKLSSIQEVDADYARNIEVTPSAREFVIPDTKPNVIAYLTPTTEQTHTYLGGSVPPGFEMPAYDVLACPFQFIGQLSRIELGLEWMPFDHLSLCYPLYTGIGETLYFDYTNPDRPCVMNNDIYVNNVYGTFDPEMHHVFEKVHLNRVPLSQLSEDQELFFDEWYEAISGVPFWMQGPIVPRCLRSGKTMRFVAQLTTYDRVRVSESTMVSDYSHFENDASTMSFWAGGAMYVFMEPETKVVGIYIQST